MIDRRRRLKNETKSAASALAYHHPSRNRAGFWRGNFPTEDSRGDYVYFGFHGSAVGSP